MKEEEKITNVSGQAVEDNADYIAAIKELKENSVDKTQYEKLRQENKQLLDSLVNGTGNANEQSTQEVKVDVKELKEHLMEDGISNLDYVTTALKLRNEVLAKEDKDLFCPVGTQYTPSNEDIASAEKVAAELQRMVDEAEGNNDIFNNEFQRGVVDVSLPKRH